MMNQYSPAFIVTGHESGLTGRDRAAFSRVHPRSMELTGQEDTSVRAKGGSPGKSAVDMPRPYANGNGDSNLVI